jgi:hypothetical protein
VSRDRIEAVHVRGRTVAALHQLELEQNSSDEWEPVKQGMSKLIEMCKPGEIKVLLSDSLVRYFRIPWRTDLRNAAERNAYSSMLFEDTYGEGSQADWTLASDDMYPGKDYLCSAMPSKLLDVLKACTHQFKSKLVFVRPMMVASLRLCSSCLAKSGWFASHEPGRVSLIGWTASGWQWVSSVRLATDTADCLVTSLKRELIVAPDLPPGLGESQSIFVFAPLLNLQDGLTSNGLQLSSWKSPKKFLTQFTMAAAKLGHKHDSKKFRLTLLGAYS